MPDDDFEPLLGRIRASPAKRGKRYLHRLLVAGVRAGRSGRGARSFDGSRVGRGAGIGRLLGSGDRFAGFRSRRAIVKTRLVRLRGRGLGAARAHLRYIQRDGVQRDGSPGQLYSADRDEADGKAFIDRCEGDRHQFRMIVSAEDGAEYQDLKPLIRRFMARMEEDLGTRLDWVGVDHVDTAQPHSHIMLRGRDELGRNLVISREYISRGMRERAAELVTLDLGPRQDSEIRLKLRREISAERLTSIDRGLVRTMSAGGIVSAGHRDPFQHALRAGRLRKLEAMGLAEPVGGGKWKLAARIEDRLRHLGERGDIIRTMQRELAERGLERPPADRVVHRDAPAGPGVVGRLIARSLSDEMADRHYLLVDGIDGRVHHIDIGRGDAVEALPQGSIVRIRRREPGTSAPDLAGQAAAHELRAHLSPLRVELVSPLPLDLLPDRDGATWLDRQLAGDSPEPLRDSGFGREVRSALALRRNWLLAHGLGGEIDGHFSMRPGALAALRQRELSAAASQLSGELGLSFAPSGEGDRVEGVLRRRLDLASGRFALVENGRDFSLVPWRSLLERHMGKEVSGIVRRDGIGWSIGRGRSGPEIG